MKGFDFYNQNELIKVKNMRTCTLVSSAEFRLLCLSCYVPLIANTKYSDSIMASIIEYRKRFLESDKYLYFLLIALHLIDNFDIQSSRSATFMIL